MANEKEHLEIIWPEGIKAIPEDVRFEFAMLQTLKIITMCGSACDNEDYSLIDETLATAAATLCMLTDYVSQGKKRTISKEAHDYIKQFGAEMVDMVTRIAIDKGQLKTRPVKAN